VTNPPGPGDHKPIDRKEFEMKPQIDITERFGGELTSEPSAPATMRYNPQTRKLEAINAGR
jgi:hypothetical protein